MDAALDATALRKRIRDANQDIERRIRGSHLSLQYDAEMDYLYVRFDRQDEDSVRFNVDSVDPDDTLSLIVEESTLAVVGMDIMRFREIHLAKNGEARDLFEPILSHLDYEDFRLVISPKGKWAIYIPSQVESALEAAA